MHVKLKYYSVFNINMPTIEEIVKETWDLIKDLNSDNSEAEIRVRALVSQARDIWDVETPEDVKQAGYNSQAKVTYQLKRQVELKDIANKVSGGQLNLDITNN